MSDLFELLKAYLDFPDSKSALYSVDYSDGIIGNQIDLISNDFETDGLKDYSIAIVGVTEQRNNKNKGCEFAPDKIREQLFKLSLVSFNFKLLDLGNLKLGKSFSDTHFALRELVKEMHSQKIIIIIIGGGQSLTYAQYMAYEDVGYAINIAAIDNKIDIGDSNDELNSENYLSKIIIENGNHLFNFTNLGYQRYLVSPNHISLMDKLYFDTIRLGDLQTDIRIAEHYLRDSNLVSFDISAIRQSEAPAYYSSRPNGLFGNEACQLARYSGLSENVTSFGLYEVNPEFDLRDQTQALSAQIIWHFIDGFYHRLNDAPYENHSDFTEYDVDVMSHKIKFLHSNRSDRWWMEVLNSGDDGDMIKVVSCSLSDYQIACSGEVPDRWWKTFQKIS